MGNYEKLCFVYVVNEKKKKNWGFFKFCAFFA